MAEAARLETSDASGEQEERARLEARAAEADRLATKLTEAEAKRAEAEAEVEVVRSNERFASLQAQMQSKRADEIEREMER